MSNHFIAINRGKSGSKISDLVFATSSTAAADVELRIADVDAQGKVMTDKDIFLALEAFRQAIFSRLYTTFPPL
jgi:hypothetical protein